MEKDIEILIVEDSLTQALKKGSGLRYPGR